MLQRFQPKTQQRRRQYDDQRIDGGGGCRGRGCGRGRDAPAHIRERHGPAVRAARAGVGQGAPGRERQGRVRGAVGKNDRRRRRTLARRSRAARGECASGGVPRRERRHDCVHECRRRRGVVLLGPEQHGVHHERPPQGQRLGEGGRRRKLAADTPFPSAAQSRGRAGRRPRSVVGGDDAEDDSAAERRSVLLRRDASQRA